MKVQKEYTSFSTAIALEEIDYDGAYMTAAYSRNNGRFLASYCPTVGDADKVVIAPLLQQAFSWFLDKHNLHVEYMFYDMTWQARIGEFTVPDFVPDEVIGLDESEGIRDAKRGYLLIRIKALDKMIEIIKDPTDDKD